MVYQYEYNLMHLMVLTQQDHMVTATAKAHADTNLVQHKMKTDGLGTEGEVATRGLKYNLIRNC